MKLHCLHWRFWLNWFRSPVHGLNMLRPTMKSWLIANSWNLTTSFYTNCSLAASLVAVCLHSKQNFIVTFVQGISIVFGSFRALLPCWLLCECILSLHEYFLLALTFVPFLFQILLKSTEKIDEFYVIQSHFLFFAFCTFCECMNVFFTCSLVRFILIYGRNEYNVN